MEVRHLDQADPPHHWSPVGQAQQCASSRRGAEQGPSSTLTQSPEQRGVLLSRRPTQALDDLERRVSVTALGNAPSSVWANVHGSVLQSCCDWFASKEPQRSRKVRGELLKGRSLFQGLCYNYNLRAAGREIPAILAKRSQNKARTRAYPGHVYFYLLEKKQLLFELFLLAVIITKKIRGCKLSDKEKSHCTASAPNTQPTPLFSLPGSGHTHISLGFSWDAREAVCPEFSLSGMSWAIFCVTIIIMILMAG